VFVSLMQPDRRIERDARYTTLIGLTMLRCARSPDMAANATRVDNLKTYEVVEQTAYECEREVAMDVDVTPEYRYIIVPSTFTPNEVLPYSLAVYINHGPEFLRKLVPPGDFVTATGFDSGLKHRLLDFEERVLQKHKKKQEKEIRQEQIKAIIDDDPTAQADATKRLAQTMARQVNAAQLMATPQPVDAASIVEAAIMVTTASFRMGATAQALVLKAGIGDVVHTSPPKKVDQSSECALDYLAVFRFPFPQTFDALCQKPVQLAVHPSGEENLPEAAIAAHRSTLGELLGGKSKGVPSVSGFSGRFPLRGQAAKLDLELTIRFFSCPTELAGGAAGAPARSPSPSPSPRPHSAAVMPRPPSPGNPAKPLPALAARPPSPGGQLAPEKPKPAKASPRKMAGAATANAYRQEIAGSGGGGGAPAPTLQPATAPKKFVSSSVNAYRQEVGVAAAPARTATTTAQHAGPPAQPSAGARFSSQPPRVSAFQSQPPSAGAAPHAATAKKPLPSPAPKPLPSPMAAPRSHAVSAPSAAVPLAVPAAPKPHPNHSNSPMRDAGMGGKKALPAPPSAARAPPASPQVMVLMPDGSLVPMEALQQGGHMPYPYPQAAPMGHYGTSSYMPQPPPPHAHAQPPYPYAPYGQPYPPQGGRGGYPRPPHGQHPR